MANQTVTTEVNHDSTSVLGLNNGEQYSIDGGKVIVNADVRWGQNNAVLGNMLISTTLGGSILFDGRDIWEIPFDASSGNVPTLNNLGSNGVTGGTSLATGELFRVWATGELYPRASGGAMPSSGYIKLRTKSGTFLNDEVITLPGGATITVNSSTGGKRSWIQIVGGRTLTITIPRLGKLEAFGDWYYLDNTNGADNQQISIPFIDEVPAVQIETSPGSDEYEWWLNAGDRWQTFHANALSFIPTDARGKYFGQGLRLVSDAATTTGSNIVTVTSTTGLTIGSPIVFSAGFSDGDNLYISDIISATQFRVSTNSNATGTGRTIRTFTPFLDFAHRGTYDCGQKPTSGCKVRIPNVILGTTTAGPADSNQWRGQISEGVGGDRWDLTTTAAGAVEYDKVLCCAYTCATSAAYSISMKNTASFSQLHSNTATAPLIEDSAVGISRSNNLLSFNFSNQFTGITIKRCRGCRYADGSNTYSWQFLDCANVIMEDTISEIFPSTSANTHGSSGTQVLFFSRCFDLFLTRPTIIGARMTLTQVTNATIIDVRHADSVAINTVSTNGMAGIEVSNTSSNININGFASYDNIANIHPYNQILNITTSAKDITFSNLGTASSPYNMGSSNACGTIVSASVSLNITLRRLYSINTRTAPLGLSNTVQNVLIENVWGDYADTQAIAALNCLAKGCAWTNSVVGQSSVYGRHWEDAFTSTTAGRILIACNEPLPDTASQVQTSFALGSGFTSAGGLSMATLNDNVIWEMPYYALGITALANTAPTITGTNTGNHLIEFQYDLGSGYNGTWLTANASNLSGVGAINPATGIKLKVRATVTTAANNNNLLYIRLDTITTSTDQQIQYPLPGIPFTITGLNPNTEVRAYVGTDPTTATEIAGVENSGTSFSFTHTNNGQEGYIKIFNLDYQPLRLDVTYSANATSIPVQQVRDRVFENP